ncbi:hypothetical protein TNIN_128471 [Trichonephila inaurata madagascariensis]|uniref:Uncharacterized protein n=1 Tax=Trichonephila inaurata madagascariensis TaxID=2747483 RepID=A0A8X6ML05_9ARAC|nr:hypothetical protein TNIN_128471 [Trichonephila inaurata madagascariensis]
MIKSHVTFFRHLHKHSHDPVYCPECLEQMTLSHFYYKHAPNKHELDSRKSMHVFVFERQTMESRGKESFHQCESYQVMFEAFRNEYKRFLGLFGCTREGYCRGNSGGSV